MALVKVKWNREEFEKNLRRYIVFIMDNGMVRAYDNKYLMRNVKKNSGGFPGRSNEWVKENIIKKLYKNVIILNDLELDEAFELYLNNY